MAESVGEHYLGKPNRRAKQEPKKHSMLSQRVLGLPKGARALTRKQKDKRLADRVKRAQR